MIRRSPLKRRATKKKRSRAVRCSVRGCKRPAKVMNLSRPLSKDELAAIGTPDGAAIGVYHLCLTHAKREADRLFSLRVREGVGCQRCGAIDSLQCSHFISRRYLGTRWNLLNAECLCARCHKKFTEDPLAAEAWAIGRLGEHAYTELKRIARAFVGPVDYAAVLASLGGTPDDR